MMTADEDVQKQEAGLRVGVWVQVEDKPVFGQVIGRSRHGCWWVRFPTRCLVGLPWTDVVLPAVMLTEIQVFICPCSHHHQDDTTRSEETP